ncbi:MAG: hypothetical protein RL211_1902 [Pseudomonadota bacterium]
MISFTHTEFPKTHGGVERAEFALQYFAGMRRSLNGSRGLATLLLAGGVAAFVSVADQMIDTWADGHLLTAWVVLWAVTFAVLALFANAARTFAARMTVGAQQWAKRLAQDRADAHLLNTARQDPRVMADIQAAISRAEVQQELIAEPAVKSALAHKEALKARAESDRLMWNAAMSDPRLMEDLQEAVRRAETTALAIQDPIAQEAALAEIRATAMRYPAVKRVVKRSFLVGIPANLRQIA